MDALWHLFSIDNIMFTVFGYEMSFIEFFGTILNLACVYLVAKKIIWSWPIGIVAVILFGILFYQLNLYADMLEQIYYFVTGFIGWYAWSTSKKPADEDEGIVVNVNGLKTNLVWAAGIITLSAVGTWAMARVHLWLPALFPEPASLPLLDVSTTVMSFAAQALLIAKRLESWVLWIIVDIIAIGLYWYKGVMLVSLLYAIFLVLATGGLITWHKTWRRERHGTTPSPAEA